LNRDLKALADHEYDLIVIGGGIFGACAAWDAALRGLSVALLEKADFGHATSANHFKIVHGGIRYLQHADFYRVRESSRERSALLRILPHLTNPLPIAIPTYGHGLKSKEAMRAALAMYHLLTIDRNRGIADEKQQIPAGHILSRQETLELFPFVHREGLTGAAIFYDGQMYNPPRITLAFIQSAAKAGAQVANYIEVTDFIQQNNRVIGVEACDQLTGATLSIRGKVVLNAAGPWADRLIAQKLGRDLNPQPVFSRDAYFVVKHRRLEHGLAIQGDTKDPDAILSRGNRHLFLVPWRDYTLVGVWHVVHKGGPEDFTLTEQDVLGFMDEVNRAYPGIALTLDDVSMWNAGLTLFGENSPGQRDLSYGKRSIIVDHAAAHGIENLLTLIGVRFTTARGMAEQAVNQVFRKLQIQQPPQSRTEFTPVYGGDMPSFSAYLNQARQQLQSLDDDIHYNLLRNYGTMHQQVLHKAQEPAYYARIGTSNTIEAEVIHAVSAEMAHKLDDVVFRRTSLAAGSNPGQDALRRCADLMAAELGWNENRIQHELQAVRSRFLLHDVVPSGESEGVTH
jgi:glycerol-3-phosphate dehydrogenase